MPKIDDLLNLNSEKADMVLTEVQNGVITKVKTAQIQLKTTAKNKLKNLIGKLGKLNNDLEQDNDPGTKDRMLEAKEAFQAEYNNHFRREPEKKLF